LGDFGFYLESHTDLTGCGTNDGTITISGLTSGNSYTITYIHNSITETLTIIADATSSYVITGLESGVYSSIMVTDNTSGCDEDLGQIVIDEPDLSLTISSTDLTGCGTNDGTIIISGLTPGNSYTIAYIHNSTTEILTIIADATGSYVITGLESGVYSSFMVTDNASVCDEDLGQIVIDEPDLSLTISSTDLTGCGTNDGTIIISGLTPDNSYTIAYVHNSTIETLTIIADATGSYVITGLESGVYSSIMVTDNTSVCDEDLGQVLLDCIEEELSCFRTKLFFTPNGDGVNDYWSLITSPNACNYKLYIYDRFGKLLRILSPEDNKWDGTYNGNNLPSNDYWYSVEYIKDNKWLTYKSHFALKR
jgi:gliding motility-associated-like protein